MLTVCNTLEANVLNAIPQNSTKSDVVGLTIWTLVVHAPPSRPSPTVLSMTKPIVWSVIISIILAMASVVYMDSTRTAMLASTLQHLQTVSLPTTLPLLNACSVTMVRNSGTANAVMKESSTPKRKTTALNKAWFSTVLTSTGQVPVLSAFPLTTTSLTTSAVHLVKSMRLLQRPAWI